MIGALNLFCARPGALSDADVRTGQALADVATIGILAQRSAQQALDSRVTIEQAKGVLAERRQITVDAAFALLRAYARNNNLHLSDLARQVADGSSTATELLSGPQAAHTDARGLERA